jgi:UDP-N-acetylmuramyl pentapeptide synthase
MKSLLRTFILNMLWDGAESRIKKEKPYVIAVTGSVGKTSTKEAIAGVLAKGGKAVFKTPGNLNSESGVALALLGFEHQVSGVAGWLSAIFAAFSPPSTPGLKKGERPYYVLEFSADKPGDIAFLAKKIPLDVGVLTSIVPAHMQSYPKFEDLVAEKLSLFSGLKPGGYAVLNANDPVQQDVNLPSISWYGTGKRQGKREGVWADRVEMGEMGLEANLEYAVNRPMDTIGKKQPHTLHIATQVLGEHQLHSLLAATVIGFREGISAPLISQAIASYQVPAGRGRIIAGRREVTIIDESYNASPEAVKNSLTVLQAMSTAQKRRGVAILGNMGELGDTADAAHIKVAEFAATRVGFLVVIGKQADRMQKAAIAAGLPAINVVSFAEPENAFPNLEQMVQRSDIVLVKASQNGMRLERLVKRLMENPEQAKDLLVRQESHWNPVS